MERVFSAGNPDPLEMERSKKVLKVTETTAKHYWGAVSPELTDVLAGA